MKELGTVEVNNNHNISAVTSDAAFNTSSISFKHDKFVGNVQASMQAAKKAIDGYVEAANKITADKLEEASRAFDSAASSAVNFGMAIGNSLSQVGNGMQSTVAVLRSATIAIIDLLEKQALAAIIRNAVIGKPPIIALALAAAGFAAVKALFSKIGGSGGGGGGASINESHGRSADSYQQQPLNIIIGGEIKLKGGDLVYAFEKQNYKQTRGTG